MTVLLNDGLLQARFSIWEGVGLRKLDPLALGRSDGDRQTCPSIRQTVAFRFEAYRKNAIKYSECYALYIV